MPAARVGTTQPLETTAALELRGVFQHVKGRCALAGVDLSLRQGEWLLIAGANGAGKSLLTRLILGLDAPSAGCVRVLGRDLGRLDQRGMRRLRAEVGAVLQGGSLLATGTLMENLLLPLRDARLSREAMARAARLVIALLQLDGLENHPPRALSLGQRRRVELARALIHRPRLLIWDGLTDGLDPGAARETLEVLRTLRQHQRLSLVATDNRTQVLADACDRLAVLERGRILFEGPPDRLESVAARSLELRAALAEAPP